VSLLELLYLLLELYWLHVSKTYVRKRLTWIGPILRRLMLLWVVRDHVKVLQRHLLGRQRLMLMVRPKFLLMRERFIVCAGSKPCIRLHLIGIQVDSVYLRFYFVVVWVYSELFDEGA